MALISYDGESLKAYLCLQGLVEEEETLVALCEVAIRLNRNIFLTQEDIKRIGLDKYLREDNNDKN